MTRIKKLTISSFLLLAVGYASKPDRGGVGRCSKIFGIPELRQCHFSHRPFLVWEFFESPKFRFTVSPSDFSRLDTTLKAAGYSAWERGGVTYGSVSHGWTPDEDSVYCSLKQGGYSYTWSYSERKNLIYAITFP